LEGTHFKWAEVIEEFQEPSSTSLLIPSFQAFAQPLFVETLLGRCVIPATSAAPPDRRSSRIIARRMIA
jgi:hypothetical protein